MAKTQENHLWRWFSKVKPYFRERLHMCRVENLVMSGMPDVEGCLDAIQFWIELKTSARPRKTSDTVKVKFRPTQPVWLRRRNLAGGRVFVLLQVGSGRQASRYLIPGQHAPKIVEGLTEDGLGKLSLIERSAKATDIVKMARGRHI